MAGKKKKKGKAFQALPEKWVKPLRELDVYSALVKVLGLTLLGVFLYSWLWAPDERWIVVLPLAFASISLGNLLPIAVGNLLGNKWGKKAPWQGFAVLVTAYSVVWSVVVWLFSRLNAGLIATVLGLILFYSIFQSYYQTSHKHAVYAALLFGLLLPALVLGMLMGMIGALP